MDDIVTQLVMMYENMIRECRDNMSAFFLCNNKTIEFHNFPYSFNILSVIDWYHVIVGGDK